MINQKVDVTRASSNNAEQKVQTSPILTFAQSALRSVSRLTASCFRARLIIIIIIILLLLLLLGRDSLPRRRERDHHQQPEPRGAEGDEGGQRALHLPRLQLRGGGDLRGSQPRGQMYDMKIIKLDVWGEPGGPGAWQMFN